eukprot:RCo038092
MSLFALVLTAPGTVVMAVWGSETARRVFGGVDLARLGRTVSAALSLGDTEAISSDHAVEGAAAGAGPSAVSSAATLWLCFEGLCVLSLSCGCGAVCLCGESLEDSLENRLVLRYVLHHLVAHCGAALRHELRRELAYVSAYDVH